MGVKEEFMDILQQAWTKLQGLPQAGPLELGAFSVLLLFVGKSRLLSYVIQMHLGQTRIK